MIKQPGLIFILILVFCGSDLFSQVNDAQLWLNAGLEKKFTRSFSVLLTQEVRLNENMTEAGSLLTDLGVSYRFMKWFRAGVAYRFSLNRRLDDTYKYANSWYAELTAREKLKPVIVAFRLRYQSKYAEPNTSEQASIPKNHVRTKLTFRYDLDKKFEPYVYGEAYFRTCNPDGASAFDELRLCAGVEYAINRMHLVDIHYMIDREYNVVNPETDYIIGIEYTIRF